MVDQTKLNEELRKLKQLIKNDPEVMGKYDLNGDGRISGEEWDVARRKVAFYLDAEGKAIQSSRDESSQLPAAGGGIKPASETVFRQIKSGDSLGIADSKETTQKDTPGYGPIRLVSFWGAVAMFFLCQIYYFILFEGFLFVLDTNFKIFYVWFGILFITSVTAQIEAMVKINNYFSESIFYKKAFYIETVEDFIKCILALALGTAFVWFCLGHYPFPSMPHNWWQTLAFYVFVWIVASSVSWNIRNGYEPRHYHGLMNLAPVIMGIVFFIASMFTGKGFYFAGTFSMGFILFPIRPLLLSDMTRTKFM